MFKTYHGGCHCGAVRFEADLDISSGTDKCNCSICTKMRLWSIKVKPAEFRIARGADNLTSYRFNSGVANHTFCRTCGVRPFERVDLPPPREAYYNVSVVCLEDLDIKELMAAPVKFEDGANDDWSSVPDEVRHL